MTLHGNQRSEQLRETAASAASLEAIELFGLVTKRDHVNNYVHHPADALLHHKSMLLPFKDQLQEQRREKR